MEYDKYYPAGHPQNILLDSMIDVITKKGNQYTIPYREFFKCVPMVGNIEEIFNVPEDSIYGNTNAQDLIINHYKGWMKVGLIAEQEHGVVYVDEFWSIINEVPEDVHHVLPPHAQYTSAE